MSLVGSTKHVVLPRTWLRADSFEHVLDAHNLDGHLRQGGSVIVEFPERCRIPAGLGICLLSWLNQLADLNTGHLSLRFAPDDDLFGYLDRNGFVGLLSPNIVTSPERPPIPKALMHHGQASGLVEIAPLRAAMGLDEMQSILRALTDKLEGLFPSTERAQRLISRVRTALAELVQNVPNHSRTRLPGFAVLQAYPNARQPRVEIGVSDSGIGIPDSLRNALGPQVSGRSDADLVLRAFEEGLSSMGKHGGRGCGLPRCAQIAAEYGSKVSVRTPSAHVTLEPVSEGSKRLTAQLRSNVSRIDGTHVWIELRLEHL